MTITNTTRTIIYSGNGAANVWSYGFIIPDTGSVRVKTIAIGTGEETVINSDDYIITGIGLPDGGTVTYPIDGPALDDTYQIMISRDVAPIQATNITNQTTFYAKVVMAVWDKLTMGWQELKDDISYTLRFSNLSGKVPPIHAPLTERSGRVLRFTDDGQGIEIGPSITNIDTIQEYAQEAQNFANSAQNSAGTAQNYAGTAQNYADGALSSEEAASAFADAAASSVAGIDRPSLSGQALKFLRVKADETGTEYAPVDIIVSNDATPQLGGVLDTNKHSIYLSMAPTQNSMAVITPPVSGNYFHISGNTSITAFAAVAIGAQYTVEFDSVINLVHSLNFVLPGRRNIITVPGDVAIIVQTAETGWTVINYTRADGAAISATPVILPVITTQVFTSSGTWTKPLGRTSDTIVILEAWGSGGGGDSNYGGGGGGYAKISVRLADMAATEIVTIGAGGTFGSFGENSMFGELLTAYGGGYGNTFGPGGGGGATGSGGAGVNPTTTTTSGYDAGQTTTYTTNYNITNGGGGGGGNGTFTKPDAISIFGGGAGSKGTRAGGSAFGGGGGGGGRPPTSSAPTYSGGTSVLGGAGGDINNAAQAPGGGGGTGTFTTGARGEVRVTL